MQTLKEKKWKKSETNQANSFNLFNFFYFVTHYFRSALLLQIEFELKENDTFLQNDEFTIAFYSSWVFFWYVFAKKD